MIDARPKRVAEKGMIPTALNISDSEFDKNIDKLPADKATPLIYYCGGMECVLSDKSAEKAKKLGHTNGPHLSAGLSGVGKTASAPRHGNSRNFMSSGTSAAASSPQPIGTGKRKGPGHCRLV
ncbi:MAG: rhodanese-like domain-containing protein [Betaproteobacteria bacterium]|nr:rhodanese-like domain-containing protein [Betaproteobacteria bacterium]